MTKSVRRAPRPKNHAEGKPVRGFIKGKRGPAMKADERLALKDKHVGPIVIETSRPNPNPNLSLSPHPNGFIPTANSRSSKLNRILQDLIQEVGRETIDPVKGWTRIEAVVRRVYADAMSGKTPAQALLFERGWGRVPQPLKVDFQTELKQVVEDSGLTAEEIAADPLLSQLISGEVVEGEFKSANAPD